MLSQMAARIALRPSVVTFALPTPKYRILPPPTVHFDAFATRDVYVMLRLPCS